MWAIIRVVVLLPLVPLMLMTGTRRSVSRIHSGRRPFAAPATRLTARSVIARPLPLSNTRNARRATVSASPSSFQG